MEQPDDLARAGHQREDPRVTRSKARILAAMLEELAERGYEATTIEGVADRAGAGKSTVYRHWTGKAELLMDALGTVRPVLPDPATGDLRSDLVAVLAATAEALAAPRSRFLPILIEAAERDPDLDTLHHQWVEERRHPLVRVLLNAVDRGELPADTDVDLAADLLGGPLMMRRLLTRGRLTGAVVERIVDTLLPGLVAGHGRAVRGTG